MNETWYWSSDLAWHAGFLWESFSYLWIPFVFVNPKYSRWGFLYLQGVIRPGWILFFRKDTSLLCRAVTVCSVHTFKIGNFIIVSVPLELYFLIKSEYTPGLLEIVYWLSLIISYFVSFLLLMWLQCRKWARKCVPGLDPFMPCKWACVLHWYLDYNSWLADFNSYDMSDCKRSDVGLHQQGMILCVRIVITLI